MRLLICPDKFKGSLTAAEVCEALERGIARSFPYIQVTSCPLADGGDGSLDVLGSYRELETIRLGVSDPLGRNIQASYRRAGSTAFVEVAAASGIVLLTPEERNAMRTSSIGTGQLIRDGIKKGATELFLFLGGSATNDGGIGIAHALGFRFLDEMGNELDPIGENLQNIRSISDHDSLLSGKKIRVKVVCDVDNPLTGPEGAAAVYGPQKGASAADVQMLDLGLKNLADRLLDQGYPKIESLAGAGAAGGIGGGAVALLGGKLQSGTQTFLEMSQLEDRVREADLILTGEGYLDAQTEQGKLISGVCELAHKHGKPIIGICGGAEAGTADALGMSEIHTIISRTHSLEEAMQQAAVVLETIGAELEPEKYSSSTT